MQRELAQIQKMMAINDRLTAIKEKNDKNISKMLRRHREKNDGTAARDRQEQAEDQRMPEKTISDDEKRPHRARRRQARKESPEQLDTELDLDAQRDNLRYANE